MARILGTAKTITTPITTATAIPSNSRRSGPAPWNWLVSIETPTSGIARRRSPTCTTVSDTSSTAPAANASAGFAPIRCRKRRFIPIRPAELGTVRLMNLIADCRTMHGSRARGVITAPRTEIPEPMNVHCARINATMTQAGVGVLQLVGDRAEPDLRELADEEIRGKDHEPHQQDVPQPNAAQRHHLGLRRSRSCRGSSRRSLSPTSWDRARSRRCGVSAARWRYGSARATASPQPAATTSRSARSGPTRTVTRRAARPRRDRATSGGRERRRREVDQHRAVVEHEHVARVEPAVRDPGRVQAADLVPEILEHLVVDVGQGRRARVGRRAADGSRSPRRRASRGRR